MLHACCALCSQPAAAGVPLGVLLGPVRDAKNPSADELYVHRLCALWSSEVFETDQGTLRNVLAAIKRGRQLKCSHCGRRGATLGCRVPNCSCSFHVACAKEAGCTYYCDQFQVACPAHAALFRAEARQQIRRTPFTPYRNAAGRAQHERAGLAAGATPGGTQQTPGAEGDGADLVSPVDLPTFVGRKRGRRRAAMEQHMVEAQAAMKRARREIEKRRRTEAEPYSSDDDEHFAKKESRRLARDTAKLNPISLMGDGTAVQHIYVKSPAPGKGTERQAVGAGAPPPQAQQQPTVETAVVGSIATTDFSSVAGLDEVVRQLREMVLLPMQYPELFEGMGIRPPRGILFHGVPGTGKTLVARALAGACAKHSPLPVTFFARKGADCLGKFHGEAERTLRLLFEEASRRAPAIIFLDELDALVPARGARGDQIYASVVSTLLSLMDGVTDRGAVIVIGATNRPEAIDPALRRPGRFDREVYFGLPTPAQRLAILRVHTQRWGRPPPDELLQQVASRAEGYAGADLQALCTAAVMAAVRRSAPLLLEQAEREAAAVGGEAAAEAAAVQLTPRLGEGQQGAGLQSGAAGAAEAERQQQRRQRLLDSIDVQAGDWREAFSAAPPPCSRRHGLSALAAEAAAPLQRQALPLVAAPLRRLLAALHAADLPLPPPAAAAAQAAAAAERQGMHEAEQEASLEKVLLQHGALLPAAGAPGAAAAAPAAGGDSTAAGGEEAQLERLGRSYAPCRLLLWGEGEQGQEAAAGALLKLFDGCPVHCLSLPSLVAEGGEDAAAACVALVTEALRRASQRAPLVFFLPRVESWALSRARMRPEDLMDGGGWFRALPDSPGSGGGGGGGGQRGPARQGGLLSPASAHKPAAVSPLGASPGHRGFLTAPSPFSGLLPLEERAGHTPAVARALRSVTQLHRQQQEQQQQAAASSGEEAPTLGDLHLRASAEPGTAGRPPRPPPAAAVLPPPAGLPPIRTSVSPEQPRRQQPRRQQRGQQQQQQQQQQQAGSAAGLPRSESPAGSEEEGGMDEDGTEVEVATLSQAWNVFESLLRQVPASQPVIVLATCHAAADATPANLAQFFAGPAPAAPGSQQAAPALHGRLGQLLPEAAAPADAACVAAPGIVRFPQQPGRAAWRRAAEAAAEQVAAAVACQAAVLLHQQLSAAEKGDEQAAGAGGTSPVTAAQRQDSQQQQAEPAQPPPPALASPGRSQRQRARGQQAAPQPPPAQQCNTAELEQGLRLFDRLLGFQREVGAALAREEAAWAPPAGRPGSAGGRRRAGGHAAPSFGDVALRCRRGEYDSLDALQADAAAAAGAALAAADEAAQQERRRGRGTDPASRGDWLEAQAAASAACAAQDKVDAACFGLRQELRLSEPAAEALLAAAAAHIRRLQREEGERRRQAAAAEDARRRAEEQAAARQRQEQQAEEAGEQQQQQEAEGIVRDEPAAEGDAAAAAPAADDARQQPEATDQEPASAAPPARQAEQPDEELDGAATAAAQERQQRQQHIAGVAQLLRQRLHDLLLPMVRQRLPGAPLPDISAWQSLQSRAGQLSAAAAAACRQALEGGSCTASAAGDALAAKLATSCAEAFQAAETTA